MRRLDKQPGEIENEKPKAAPRDLYAILRDHAESDELLRRFWKEVNTVPSWVRLPCLLPLSLSEGVHACSIKDLSLIHI